MQKIRIGVALALGLGTLFASTVFGAGPTGSSPNDALMVTAGTQTLAANSSAWFYFDYSGDRSKIEADLIAFSDANFEMSVFTPALANAWLADAATQPIGRGTKPGATTAAAIYDLVWQGAFNFPGRFFVVVKNNNATPRTFQLVVKGDSVMLAPPVTPTPLFVFVNPFATPIPTASLNGKFVFQQSSGGDIYTVNGDGSQLKRVTYGLDPAWSPDGKRIAFTRWNNPPGLYAINPDGSDEKLLFGYPQIQSPRWSPDGKSIVFTRQYGGPEGRLTCIGSFCFTSGGTLHWKLGWYNLETLYFLDLPSTKQSFAPTWNRDGRSVAFADAGFGILATDVTTNTITNLFYGNPVVQSPAYSPDGARLAFQIRAHDRWEISVMNADGSGVTPLTRPDPLSFAVVHNVAPVWSPDSQQIMFLSDRNGKWEFFVVNADGSNLRLALKSVTDAFPIRYNYSNERVIDWSR